MHNHVRNLFFEYLLITPKTIKELTVELSIKICNSTYWLYDTSHSGFHSLRKCPVWIETLFGCVELPGYICVIWIKIYFRWPWSNSIIVLLKKKKEPHYKQRVCHTALHVRVLCESHLCISMRLTFWIRSLDNSNREGEADFDVGTKKKRKVKMEKINRNAGIQFKSRKEKRRLKVKRQRASEIVTK